MLKVLDHEWLQGDYLLYKDCGKIKGGKTHRYEIYNIQNRLLVGYIKWYVPWAQYTFYSTAYMFKGSDLNEIAEVCKTYTTKFREENNWRYNKGKRPKPRQGRLKFNIEQQNVEFIKENY